MKTRKTDGYISKLGQNLIFNSIIAFINIKKPQSNNKLLTN